MILASTRESSIYLRGGDATAEKGGGGIGSGDFMPLSFFLACSGWGDDFTLLPFYKHVEGGEFTPLSYLKHKDEGNFTPLSFSNHVDSGDFKP